jgi:hypothetical protein
VITYYPAVVFAWEWYSPSCCWTTKCKKVTPTDDTEVVVMPLSSEFKTAADATAEQTAANDNTTADTANENEPPTAKSNEAAAAPAESSKVMEWDTHSMTSGDGNSAMAVAAVEKYQFLERKLHDVWAPTVHRGRWGFLAGFAVFMIICIVYASRLEVSQEPAEFVPHGDPVGEMLELEQDHFTDAAVTQVWVLSGIGEVNRYGTNPFDANDIGSATFDSSFDPSSEAAQLAYIANCEAMEEWQHLDSSIANNESGVFCPMIEFRKYVTDELNEPFPVLAAQFTDKLVNFTGCVFSVSPSVLPSLHLYI